MPALFVFLLKVNIALLLFCAGYYLVLRHLTFYTLNRVYLVGAILFATVYPQINLDNFARHHQQLAQPVQAMVLHLQAPAETLVKPLAQPGYWYWAEVLFFAGAAFMAIRLLMQLFSLYKLHRRSVPMKIRDHDVRIIHGNDGPFSFWKSIYINPAKHIEADLKAILKHEQIHVDEWHTLDILLAEISTIFYWFNPGIWLMKKAVRENIEFITDRKILRSGADSKQYQYSLVNVSFAVAPHTIVNNFNLSTIKKRIVMMNAKRSSKINLTRYAFLVPLLLICLFAFSFSKAELIKKSKSTYKTLEVTVKDIALTNPITSFFQKRDKSILTARSIDTIKIIRSGHKDTIKIVQANGNIYNLANGYRVGNLNIDTNGKPRLTGYSNFTVFNLKTDTMGGRVQLRRGGPGGGAFLKADTIRMNGKTYYKFNYRFGKDSLLNGLAGKVAGLQITSTGAGVSPSISLQLRGPRAVNGSNPALIIVDGVPLSSNDIATIDPNTIESYDILNGEAAGKTYGVKGANGVIVITTKKGSTAGIRLRGNTSSGTNQPLIVVDGVPYEGGINDINPQDIKRVEVLKDASAVATYGARASDGVILVTTNRGLARTYISGNNKTFGYSTTYNTYTVDDNKNGAVKHDTVIYKQYSANRPVIVRGYPTAAAATAAEKRKDSLLNRMLGVSVSSTGVVTHDSVFMKKLPAGVKLMNIKNASNISSYDVSTGMVTHSVDHLTDKLTIIDGKEATAKDLKKLRASDIESMSVKKGPKLVEQYGDKAKDGVVFITTTKAKK